MCTNVLDKGHVILEEVFGSELSIVNSARVSLGQASDEMGDRERGLINFLIRKRHGSPLEHVIFRFDIKAPLFVVREWQRHRISSFNEQSARYSEISPDYYEIAPKDVRQQVGKPGNYTYEPIDDPDVNYRVREVLNESMAASFAHYDYLINLGVAKEVARIVLPVGMYTRMKYVANLRSLLNFLQLRNHDEAQREIRFYAEAIEDMVGHVLPTVMEAFNKHGRLVP